MPGFRLVLVVMSAFLLGCNPPVQGLRDLGSDPGADATWAHGTWYLVQEEPSPAWGLEVRGHDDEERAAPGAGVISLAVPSEWAGTFDPDDVDVSLACFQLEGGAIELDRATYSAVRSDNGELLVAFTPVSGLPSVFSGRGAGVRLRTYGAIEKVGGALVARWIVATEEAEGIAERLGLETIVERPADRGFLSPSHTSFLVLGDQGEMKRFVQAALDEGAMATAVFTREAISPPPPEPLDADWEPDDAWRSQYESRFRAFTERYPEAAAILADDD
ncbi:MAG: hypothetical protein AAGI53_06430 [Planctomycetota bacterium]